MLDINAYIDFIKFFLPFYETFIVPMIGLMFVVTVPVMMRSILWG